MPNTANQLNNNIEQRLAELSAFNSDVADMLRVASEEPVYRYVPPSDPVEKQLSASGNTAYDIVVILGSGSKQDMEQLIQHTPESCPILYMERCMPAAFRLFKEWPLDEYIKSGRIVCTPGHDEAEVEEAFLSLLNIKQAPNVRLIEMAQLHPDDSQFYHSALRRIFKTVHLNVFNLGTLVFRGPLWQHNTIRNLPHIIHNPGTNALDNLFPGKPAIVVGAGPSLNDALPYLADVQDQFVIVSTGTALRALKNAGIQPDIVMAVDASHKTGSQFQVDCADLYLACSSLVFPPIIPKFKGIFSTSMTANPISQWLSTVSDPKGTLIAAGTVTTTGIDLAIQMGCNPVICLGTDLCFKKDGTTHADNTMYHGSRLDPNRLKEVPGNFENTVLTTEQFHCYIDLLSDFIKTKPETRFINATTGGARIDGMTLVDPSELKTFAAEPFDAYTVINHQHARFTSSTTPYIKQELETILTQIKTIRNEARRAAMTCNRIIMLLKSPCQGDDIIAEELLNELSTIDNTLTESKKCSVFLDMSLWPIGYKNGTRPDLSEQRYSEALLINRRSRDLYEQIAGAAKWTAELMEQVIQELETMEPRSTILSTQTNNTQLPPAEEQNLLYTEHKDNRKMTEVTL